MFCNHQITLMMNLRKSGKVIPDEERKKLNKIVAKISSLYASRLYSVCLKIGVAHNVADPAEKMGLIHNIVDEDINASLWIARKEDIALFYNSFCVMGRFMDHLHDATLFTTEERLEKWKKESSEWAVMCEEHRKKSELIRSRSERLFLDRGENEEAYKRVNFKDFKDFKGKKQWVFLLTEDVDTLVKKPPTFWWSINLSGVDTLHVRAILHKVHLIEEAYGNILPVTFKDYCNVLHEGLILPPAEESCLCFPSLPSLPSFPSFRSLLPKLSGVVRPHRKV